MWCKKMIYHADNLSHMWNIWWGLLLLLKNLSLIAEKGCQPNFLYNTWSLTTSFWRNITKYDMQNLCLWSLVIIYSLKCHSSFEIPDYYLSHTTIWMLYWHNLMAKHSWLVFSLSCIGNSSCCIKHATIS